MTMPLSVRRNNLMGIALWLGVLQVVFSTMAWGETRTLKLYFVHTKERATITFRKDGLYLQDGLARLNAFLRDWRNGEQTQIDPRLMDLLWEVHQDLGGRGEIHVLSAYRTHATNNMLRSRSRNSRVAKASQHTLGKAIDFTIPGVSLKAIRDAALRKEAGGVGYYPTFIHIDTGGVRHWPRLNRKELLAAFPDGKTIHVPADGKPLQSYATALAEHKRRKSKPDRSITVSRKTVSPSENQPTKQSLLAHLLGRKPDATENSEAETTPRPNAYASVEPTRLSMGAGPQSLNAVDPVVHMPDTLDIIPIPRPVVGDAERQAALLNVPAVEPASPLPVESGVIPRPQPSPRRGGMVIANAPLPQKKPAIVEHDRDEIAELVAAYAAVADKKPSHVQKSPGNSRLKGVSGNAPPHFKGTHRNAFGKRSLPAFITVPPDVMYQNSFEQKPRQEVATGRFEGRAVRFLPIIRFSAGSPVEPRWSRHSGQ
ncbi:hypothetical protein A33O_03780 [Nitratireductor aquibiodomus RA22]|uniref:Murein endopeptidase K n=1 Tax=Nitratireductor aquibiodomus RA22 TaxID=1189611 RepID=I5C559_9HYPH|nr:hypothetical protein A33O_03780 [Nitratireductor aquibiodomus RA22]